MDQYQGIQEITSGPNNNSLNKMECNVYADNLGKVMNIVDQPNDPYGCYIFKDNDNIIWNPTGIGDCKSTHSCLSKNTQEIILDNYQKISNLSTGDTIKVYHKGIYKGSFVIQNKVDTSTNKIKNVTWKNKIANKPVFGFGDKNLLKKCFNADYNEDDWKDEHACSGTTIGDFDLDKECCFQKCISTKECKCATWMKNNQNKCRLETGPASSRPGDPFEAYNTNNNMFNPDAPSRVMFSGSGMIGGISIVGASDDKWYDAKFKKWNLEWIQTN